MQESLIEKSWPAAGISRIKAETLFGNITVTGQDRDDIKVELTGKFYGWQFWAANRNARSDMEFYDIVLEQQGNAILIKTALKGGLRNWLRFMSMNFRILVPQNKGFESDIRAEAGSIRIENYLGDLQIKSGAGNIKFVHVRGEVVAKTFAGTIKIRNCKADIKAQTSAGTLDAKDSEGSLSLTTSGGTIDIQNITGNVYASSSAGSIDIKGVDGMVKVSTAAGSIDIKGVKGSLGAFTNMGNIHAEVAQLGDFLSVETQSGNAHIRMPVDQAMQLSVTGMRIRAPKFPGFEGEFTRSRIAGKTGNGGPSVDINCLAGNVKINSYQQNAFDSFEKTFTDSDFTLPSNFFQFDLKGIVLSFAVCLLLTYGFSAIMYFTSEQINNTVMRQVYTGIVLGYVMDAAVIVGIMHFFTRYFESRFRDNLTKYLVLSVTAFVITLIGQIILGITYWQFIEMPTETTGAPQPSFIYLFIPPMVACLYFFFWQRSKQITRKISEQEFQLLSLEKLKTTAELDALQARINPHFLYNALNSIAGLVHEDADKAEKMTMLLSKLFRFTIGTKDQHFNTVENELEIVTTYLDIEQVRFGTRLSYALDIEPGLESINIPRFLLQPVVENAIKHGISKISGEGRVIIKMEKVGGQIRCSIHDNGPAFTDNFFTGYGLQSIQDKLKLLYGENASLDIQNDDYKQVIIQLPC